MTDQSTRDEQPVPPEIDRWNWGAFLLTWIWGIGNQTFIALLVFIPFGILIMPFVLGANGSTWAWRNAKWDSVAHFKRVQRLWAIWGIVIWIGIIALPVGLFSGILYALANSEAYELGVSKLRASSEAVDALGTPILTGYPRKIWIDFDDNNESIDLKFSATGPKARGDVVLEAIKKDGVWSFKTLTLEVDERDEIIDLLKQTRAETDDVRGGRSSAQRSCKS
jgi:hypothetical protein